MSNSIIKAESENQINSEQINEKRNPFPEKRA
jgi:hypothetical protein